MHERKDIGMIGSGGQADETEIYLKRHADFRAVSSEFVVGRLVDVSNPTEEQLMSDVIVAVGAPGLKRKLVEEWQGEAFTKSISEHALIDKSVEVGEGSIIGHGVIITTNVEVGKHVLINIGSTVSHDVKIGDFSTISPGVHIGGRVVIEQGVFIGIGATISNDVRIASGVVIGAGAVVVDSIIDSNSVHVGVPSRKIRQNEDWLNEI